MAARKLKNVLRKTLNYLNRLCWLWRIRNLETYSLLTCDFRERYAAHLAGLRVLTVSVPREIQRTMSLSSQQNESLQALSPSFLRDAVLVWNHEADVLAARTAGYRTLYVLFRCVENNLRSGKAIDPYTKVRTLQFSVRPLLQKPVALRPIILFAGEIQQAVFRCNDHDEAFIDACLQDFDKLGELFTYSSTLLGTGEWTEFLERRERLVSLFRYKVLQRLEGEFGEKCHFYIGGTARGLEIRSLGLIDQYALKGMYSVSAVNLDLGSQCGTEWLYPRSVEILSVSRRLVQCFDLKSDAIVRSALGIRMCKNLQALEATLHNLTSNLQESQIDASGISSVERHNKEAAKRNRGAVTQALGE